MNQLRDSIGFLTRQIGKFFVGGPYPDLFSDPQTKINVGVRPQPINDFIPDVDTDEYLVAKSIFKIQENEDLDGVLFVGLHVYVASPLEWRFPLREYNRENTKQRYSLFLPYRKQFGFRLDSLQIPERWNKKLFEKYAFTGSNHNKASINISLRNFRILLNASLTADMALAALDRGNSVLPIAYRFQLLAINRDVIQDRINQGWRLIHSVNEWAESEWEFGLLNGLRGLTMIWLGFFYKVVGPIWKQMRDYEEKILRGEKELHDQLDTERALDARGRENAFLTNKALIVLDRMSERVETGEFAVKARSIFSALEYFLFSAADKEAQFGSGVSNIDGPKGNDGAMNSGAQVEENPSDSSAKSDEEWDSDPDELDQSPSQT